MYSFLVQVLRLTEDSSMLLHMDYVVKVSWTIKKLSDFSRVHFIAKLFSVASIADNVIY